MSTSPGNVPIVEAKLKESLVKAALGRVDWPELEAHLDVVGLSQAHLSALCGHIRRYSDWICKRPLKSFQRQRKQFFEKLRALASSRLGVGAADEVTAVETLIAQLEHGYAGVLAMVDRIEIGKHPGTVRVSAIISSACRAYQEMNLQSAQSLAGTKQLNLTSGLRMQVDGGRSVSMDAAAEAVAASVCMTLIMESYKNGWFRDDTVVLPQFIAVGDDERFQANAEFITSACWSHWQRIDKRRRFLGGELMYYRGKQLPKDAPEHVKTLIEYQPEEHGRSEREVYDYVAHLRLQDRMAQTYWQLQQADEIAAQCVGITGDVALPPDQWVSVEEVHALEALSHILGYETLEDEERPAGLRLIEWVRGYIVLRELAKERTGGTEGADLGDRFAVLLETSELVTLLQRCGLKDQAAPRFIELTCLHKSSRDLFDCPLIRVQTTQVLLFTPAVLSTHIVMAVLSNLSNRSAVLGQKGTAFEKAVLAFFRDRGMQAFDFKARRDGEEYQYDAVVPWGDYLFVFECKNHSLSGNDPVQAYYFDLENAAHAKQTSRLAKALTTHPDIIVEKMGPQYVGLNIIPCVLHLLPYSRLDDVDGVYFTDWSAVTRFFTEPTIAIKNIRWINGKMVVTPVLIRKYWSADSPTPEEFLQQLRQSAQLQLSIAHLELKPLQFAISEGEAVATGELNRREMNVESAREALEVDSVEAPR